MTKTLKQLLEELYTKGWYSPKGTKEEAVSLGVLHTQQCVKEWLMQKRQELTIPDGWHQGILSIKQHTIDELLEELNQ